MQCALYRSPHLSRASLLYLVLNFLMCHRQVCPFFQQISNKHVRELRQMAHEATCPRDASCCQHDWRGRLNQAVMLVRHRHTKFSIAPDELHRVHVEMLLSLQYAPIAFTEKLIACLTCCKYWYLIRLDGCRSASTYSCFLRCLTDSHMSFRIANAMSSSI